SLREGRGRSSIQISLANDLEVLCRLIDGRQNTSFVPCFEAEPAVLTKLRDLRELIRILLHPGTGDAYADHIDHAVWLGSVLPLRTNVLRKWRGGPPQTKKPHPFFGGQNSINTGPVGPPARPQPRAGFNPA